MSQSRDRLETTDGEPDYRFMLYVAGDSDLSRRAEVNLRRILEACLRGRYVLEVIDVVVHPRTALHDRVTITPMAVKTDPIPLRKIIGDFTDRAKVLAGLGIDEVCRDEH